MFMPKISNIVAISIIWVMMYSPWGPVTQLLQGVGIKNPPKFLGDYNWALPAIIFMMIWSGIGYAVMIYSAALQGLPKEVYEAAEIDGAGPITPVLYPDHPLPQPHYVLFDCDNVDFHVPDLCTDPVDDPRWSGILHLGAGLLHLHLSLLLLQNGVRISHVLDTLPAALRCDTLSMGLSETLGELLMNMRITMQKTTRRTLSKLIWTTLMGLIAFTMIIPFLWMLSASMKISADVIKLPIDWIPDYFYPDNYKVIWNLDGMGKRDYHFALAYWNSIRITVINVVGSLITSSLAGYAFAKIKFRGSNILFLLYLGTMMIPTQVTLIPKFVMFSHFDLIGTIYTMILPGIFSVMGTFLMRQAFIQIQDELRESGLIDGASEFTIFRRIMLPLVQSSLASLAMVIFLSNWKQLYGCPDLPAQLETLYHSCCADQLL